MLAARLPPASDALPLLSSLATVCTSAPGPSSQPTGLIVFTSTRAFAPPDIPLKQSMPRLLQVTRAMTNELRQRSANIPGTMYRQTVSRVLVPPGVGTSIKQGCKAQQKAAFKRAIVPAHACTGRPGHSSHRRYRDHRCHLSPSVCVYGLLHTCISPDAHARTAPLPPSRAW